MPPIAKFSEEFVTLNQARNELSRMQEMFSEMANSINQIDGSLSMLKQLLDSLQDGALMAGSSRNSTINLEVSPESCSESPVENNRGNEYKWKDSSPEVVSISPSPPPKPSPAFRIFKSRNNTTLTIPKYSTSQRSLNYSFEQDVTSLVPSNKHTAKSRLKKATSRRCNSDFTKEIAPQPITRRDSNKSNNVKCSKRTKSNK